MRQFDYTKKWKKMLTPEIVRYLTTIHEYKGEQRLIAEHHADVLESLVEVAKIQSTESSNKIEGIYTSDECLKKNVLDKTMPKTRNEREIAGYRDVLNTIHENFPHIPIRKSSSNRSPDDNTFIFASLRTAGYQYSSEEFEKYLQAQGMLHSFSRKGNPYDNACIESFHSVLKKEELYTTTYYTFEEAKSALFEYIESFYNRKRRHSALDYKTPQQVEDEALAA